MKQVPMLDLKRQYEYMKKDIDDAVRSCLEHQRWIFGPEIGQLEEKIAEYLGVKHCIGTCSGTEALVLSLRALAIKLKDREFFEKTDEIITTPFTFTATGDAILRSGATPVFVDIDQDTYNIDTGLIEDYIRQKKKSGTVVGILPVHLYGQACNMDEIMNVAQKYDLFIAEDVAQAFGGKWRDRMLGSIGNTGAFSFFPSKNLGGFGDGGVLVTDDDEIEELVRMLLRHGGKDKYNVDHIGYNARLDTLQAAVVLAKLKYIDEFSEKRRRIADKYNKGLKGIPGLTLPVTQADAFHVYHQYTIRTQDGNRNDLQKQLKDMSVSTMVYYPYPLHKMKVFGDGRSISHGILENAENSVLNVLSLPMDPLQETSECDHVIECIKKYFKS